MSYNFKIFNSITDIADFFTNLLKSEIDLSATKLNLVLSGGNAPKPVYKYLADQNKIKLNWNKINFFWGDERCVPPDSTGSNYKMVKDALFSKINIPEENIFRINGENDPYSEAQRYSELIGKNVPSENRLPKFDMILLGLGEDGHVASIFPDQMDLIFDNNFCKVSIHPATKQKRITLTGKAINNAKNIIFIVTGKNKSEVVADILNKNEKSIKYPASYINPTNGKLIWLLDEDAGDNVKE